MEWIENQPVQFIVADTCETCDETIAQLSDNTDTIQVQFRLSSCGGVNLLDAFADYPDNTWVLPSGWAIDANLCHTGVSLQSATVELPAASFPDGYYKFVIVVTSFNGVGRVRVKYGVFPSYDTIGDITGVGTWEFWAYIHPAGVPPNVLLFSPSVAGVEICFESVNVYNVLQNGVIAVYDADTDLYAGTGITYGSNPSLWVFSEDTVTVSLQWSALSTPLSNGCYYLCLWNPCLNSGGQNYPASITNPNFTGGSTDWALLGGASYSANTIVFSVGILGSIEQTLVFNAYINQCVTIVATAVTGNLYVYFGTALIQTITSAGTYNVCGTPVGTLSIMVTSPAGSSATVTSVDYRVLATTDYTCDLQSNTFKLADYTDKCSKLISASNTENGLGFVFGSGSSFVPQIRLDAKLKGMKYPSERNFYENSAGTKIVTYFSGRKAKNFCVDLQPEYVHDFLRLLFGFDNFYIDSVLYFVEDDEYNVEIPDVNDNVGSVKFLVSTRTQDVKNTNC